MFERPTNWPEKKSDGSPAEEVQNEMKSNRAIIADVQQELAQKVAESELLREKISAEQNETLRDALEMDLAKKKYEVSALKKAIDDTGEIVDSLGDVEDSIKSKLH